MSPEVANLNEKLAAILEVSDVAVRMAWVLGSKEVKIVGGFEHIWGGIRLEGDIEATGSHPPLMKKRNSALQYDFRSPITWPAYSCAEESGHHEGRGTYKGHGVDCRGVKRECVK